MASSSRISTPAPSPTTKPSRSRSKGRLARVGSSLRVDSARIAAKPPTPMGVMAASEPPAIMTSASPRRMISHASPIACAEAEHAVQVAEFGPFAPNRIDTWPAARLMIADGMKNGEIFRGPPFKSAMCSRSMVVNPPMPDAMKTPAFGASCAVTFSAASSIANCDAAIAYWMKMSIFLTSFLSTNCRGSKPRTSPAMRAANCAASKCVIAPMPLRPDVRAPQLDSVPMPSGDTSPMPVTTTRRRLAMWLLFGFGVRLDVLDRFFHTRDLFSVFVRDFDPEFLFEGHDELDGVERVGAQVVDKRRIRRHLFFVDPELLHDDALHFVGYGHKSSYVYMYIPPLTASTCPVIYDASSDARKHAAAATSSTVPSRPSGICRSSSPCAAAATARVMSVSIIPGAMTLTVIAREATSRASALANPISP